MLMSSMVGQCSHDEQYHRRLNDALPFQTSVVATAESPLRMKNAGPIRRSDMPLHELVRDKVDDHGLASGPDVRRLWAQHARVEPN